MSAQSDQDAAAILLPEAITGSLKDLLSDGDVKPLLLACLKEAGCQPPLNHAVLFVLQRAAGGAVGLVATPVRKWLAELFARLPLVRALLEKLGTLSREGHARAQFIAALRTDLRLPDGSPMPESTDLDLVSAMATHRDLGGLCDLVAGIGPVVAELLRDLENARTAPCLGWPEQPQGGAARTTASGLIYNSGRDAFLGRDDMIALLDRFCGDPTLTGPLARFRWMTLVGDGGEGKTRLAYEFTKQLKQRGWRAGRLALADLRQLSLAQWLPAWPTFIVIDYAAQDPARLFELLSALSRKATEPMAPVRVLLLERSTSGDWFKRLRKGADSEADAVRAYGLVLDNEPWWQGRQLPPLIPEVTIGLMQRRLEEASVPPVEPAKLMLAALSVDPRTHIIGQEAVPVPRPLFALAVAEEIIAAHRNGQPAQEALAQLDRDEVLRTIWRRDREQFWLPAAGYSEAALRPFENLACLATLIGGLTLDQLKAGAFGAGACLPIPPDPQTPNPLKSPILAAMGLARDGHIAPVEPDLLGARFVFDHLDWLKSDAGGADCALITAAWKAPFPHAGEFVARGCFDARDDTFSYRLLIPSLTDNLAVENWADLLSDLASVLSRVRDWGGLESILVEVTRARKECSLSRLLTQRLARALFNVVTHCAESFQWTLTDLAIREIEAIVEEGHVDMETALDISHAFVNVAIYACHDCNWDKVVVAVERIHYAGAKLEQTPQMRASFGHGYVAVAGLAGKAGRWDIVETCIKHIHEAEIDFPGSPEVAYLVAKVQFNLVDAAWKLDLWDRVVAGWDKAILLARRHDGFAATAAGKAAMLACTSALRAGKLELLTSERVSATASLLPQTIRGIDPDSNKPIVGPGLALIKALFASWGHIDEVKIAHDWATNNLMAPINNWAWVPDIATNMTSYSE